MLFGTTKSTSFTWSRPFLGCVVLFILRPCRSERHNVPVCEEETAQWLLQRNRVLRNSHRVRGQPGLCSQFRASHGYTVKPSLNNKEINVLIYSRIWIHVCEYDLWSWDVAPWQSTRLACIRPWHWLPASWGSQTHLAWIPALSLTG